MIPTYEQLKNEGKLLDSRFDKWYKEITEFWNWQEKTWWVSYLKDSTTFNIIEDVDYVNILGNSIRTSYEFSTKIKNIKELLNKIIDGKDCKENAKSILKILEKIN